MTQAANPDSGKATSGFTLVELMVALFIFGLLSAAGTSLLFYSSNAQTVTIAQLAELTEEQRMGALLTNDLAQAQPRISRDSSGQRKPAFGGGESQKLLHYVRGGVQGSELDQRSGVQSVEWRLDGDRLVRNVSAMVDGSPNIRSQLIASGVTKAMVRFRRNGIWQNSWEPEDPSALPQAVELVVARRGMPEIRRLFLVGAGR